MHPTNVIAFSFALITPALWTIMIARLKWHYQAQRYAFFCFLTISIIFLAHFGHRMHIYPLSLAINPVFPLALTILPILYLFFLWTSATQAKTLPRYNYLYFLPCMAVFLLWNYMFLIRTSPQLLKPFFFDIMFLQHSRIPNYLQPVCSVHMATIILFGIGLAAVVVIPVFFIPQLAQNKIPDHSDDRKPPELKFHIQLSIIFVLCIGTIVHLVTMAHAKTGWVPTLFDFFWGTGIFIAGYLIYRDLSFKNKGEQCEPAVINPGNDLEARLRSYFETGQPYLEPDLKLTDIVEAMGSNRTYVSYLIHVNLKTNFNDLVNKYRIQEAVRLLHEEKFNAKIIEIAFRSGFNSYSPFYKAFRKEIGITPKDYIKKMKN
jgi:AraC-like DNA-binding protein